MKFSCNQSDLSSNLSLISRAIPSRPTHPVLANVLLVADSVAQQISLTGFDLSLGIKTSFDAQIEVGGKIALPAKLLFDIVSRLPDGQITLEEAEEYLMAIAATSGRYQVRGMDAGEYPALPDIEDSQVFELSVENLIEGLHGTLFATSTDETKQILTGVHLTGKVDGLEFAATDGHRMAMVETFQEEGNSENPGKALEVTVPAKALREVIRLLGNKKNEKITLKFDRAQLILEHGNQRLTSRLLEGTFPAYRQLLPTGFKRSVTVDRKQFISALDRVSVLADQKNKTIKAFMDSENQSLTLSIDAKDIGSGQESLPIQMIGDTIEVVFNVEYLVDSLKNIATQEVRLNLNEALNPVVIEAIGGAKATHLIMPIQLRS